MLDPSTERLCIDNPSARARPKPRAAPAQQSPPLGRRPQTLALPPDGRAFLSGPNSGVVAGQFAVELA
jgi:hypothetical protein